MSKGINPVRKARLKKALLDNPEISLRQAVLKAGYSQCTANHEIGRLTTLKNVLAEIDKEFKVSDVTVENVLKKIHVGQDLALSKKDYASYTSLVQLEGKYLAMFTDKSEVKQSITDERRQELLTLSNRINLD